MSRQLNVMMSTVMSRQLNWRSQSIRNRLRQPTGMLDMLGIVITIIHGARVSSEEFSGILISYIILFPPEIVFL